MRQEEPKLAGLLSGIELQIPAQPIICSWEGEGQSAGFQDPSPFAVSQRSMNKCPRFSSQQLMK